jgi:hypothetical protein
MWEGGDCPFCKGSNTEYIESRREISEIGVGMWYGGYAQCKDCGCNENTDVSNWIKENSDIIK